MVKIMMNGVVFAFRWEVFCSLLEGGKLPINANVIDYPTHDRQ